MKRRERIRDRETFHLEVPADENNLSEVRDFIAKICDRAGFSKSETNNTKLAVDEACTNIIKHAYKEKGGDIRIDVQAAPGTVEISIFDRGEPFDWSKVKEPDLDHYVEIGKKGGLGIYLMNRLMDNLSYSASPAGNRLSMTKRAAAAAASHAPLFDSIIRPKWTSTLRFKFAMRAALGFFGLITFLWVILFYRQTHDLRDRVADAWLQRKRIAEIIASSSVGALTKDPYDVSGLELSTDAIPRQMRRAPEVKYIRVVHEDGRIFASNRQEEFLTTYAVPVEVRELERGAGFRSVRDDSLGSIREFHQTVYLTDSERGQTTAIGRVVVGVSEPIVTEDIIDPRPMMTLLLVGVFAAGVALLYLLVAIFVRPIQALTDGVRAIGEGSLNDEIQITGPQEIGEIARAFNEITSKFRDAQKNVVEQERLHKEMQVAQEIQQTLLPKRVPAIGGYDIASLYRAAKEVGGDYYDFVRVDDDTLGVVVADVSGKGVPGSLVMTMIRTALRMEARGNHSAAEVMARMNDFVTEDMKKGMFVTIFYSILDSKNRIISYASAGHNPMILFRAETDETYFLNPRGFPVGIKLPDDTLFRRSIDVEKIKLKKDDMLVIYTDGVTEAMNVDRDQYGEDRLIRLIKDCGRLSPQEFIDRLNADIKGFTGDQPQNDDITVVAIKEKLMADEVLYGIRRKLLDLVEVQGVSVAEACRMMRVSPSTYYRYKKRLVELGDRGLQDKTLRREVDIRRVSVEQRKGILEIIRANPRFGAKKIAALYNDGKEERAHLSAAIVYDELKRIRLNTYEMRLEYLRRNRLITDDEFKTLMAAHGSRPRESVEAPAGGEIVPADAVAETEPEAPKAKHVPRAPRAAAAPARRRFAREAFETGEGKAIEVTSEELDGGAVALHVAGHLDSSSAGELEGILESVHEYGYRNIIVDLAAVTYISSGGWGIFTGRVKTLREADGDVVLAGMSSEVYDIYELLGFQQIIMQFPSVEEAVAYIGLPLAERRSRLEKASRETAPLEPAETPVAAGEPAAGGDEIAEPESPWAALKIEAGTVGDQGEITVLYLDGVVDTVSCVKLRGVLDGLVDRGAVKIVLDMSRVEYVSSSGWGVFASRIRDIRLRAGDIKIFGMDQEVDGIFHMLGFDSIMRSFGILTEAIEDFKNDAPALASEDETSDEEPPEAAGAASERASEPAAAALAIASAGGTGREGRTVVVRIGGAIDSSTSEAFEAELDARSAERPKNLVLDLSRLVYISSGGWGIIIRYMQKLGETGGRVVVAGMNSIVLKIFRDLGFEPLIPHYGTLEKALEDLAPGMRGGEASPEEEAPAPAAETRPGAEVRKHDLADALLGAPDMAPLKPLEPVKDPEKVIFIDFKRRTDVREDKDKRIKRLGWDEYGKRLLDSGRKPRRTK
ncbi:MAG: STAS domain-containing protein [Candidatus Latescibacterota bacterium]|nr:MAG: STAS domain-containing protein [Candidatus Latescibacterota bacterium]